MSDDQKRPEEDPQIKVTDRRMFTADGELREDYRHLERERRPPAAEAARPAAEAPEGTVAEAPPPPSPASPASAASAASADGQVGDPAPEPGPRLEIPTSGATRPAEFIDLVGLLAEPVALYLGDARLPDGSSAENLEAARFHIDLLDVLRAKTAGNLSSQESNVLEDLLYQLRMRYVHKRG